MVTYIPKHTKIRYVYTVIPIHCMLQEIKPLLFLCSLPLNNFLFISSTEFHFLQFFMRHSLFLKSYWSWKSSKKMNICIGTYIFFSKFTILWYIMKHHHICGRCFMVYLAHTFQRANEASWCQYRGQVRNHAIFTSYTYIFNCSRGTVWKVSQ